jgi:hypothetical protein
MEGGMLHALRNTAKARTAQNQFGRANADLDIGRPALDRVGIGGEIAFSKAPARLFPTTWQKISD